MVLAKDCSLNENPFDQFQLWYTEAESHPDIDKPEACCLSTMDLTGYPDGRIVLLRGMDEKGFVFFTNSLSTKGRSLDQLAKAAMTFFWDPLGYQVRIQGDVDPVEESISNAYFANRPHLSKVGAWASKQSNPIGSRKELEAEVDLYSKKYPSDVPRPPHWIGYRITPIRMEFWIDQPSRLHDRFLYRLQDDEWRIYRLNP